MYLIYLSITSIQNLIKIIVLKKFFIQKIVVSKLECIGKVFELYVNRKKYFICFYLSTI